MLVVKTGFKVLLNVRLILLQIIFKNCDFVKFVILENKWNGINLVTYVFMSF